MLRAYINSNFDPATGAPISCAFWLVGENRDQVEEYARLLGYQLLPRGFGGPVSFAGRELLAEDGTSDLDILEQVHRLNQWGLEPGWSADLLPEGFGEVQTNVFETLEEALAAWRLLGQV